MLATNSSHKELNNTRGPDAVEQAYWYWTIRCVIAALIVVGNATIIGLIITRKRLHTTTNWLTLSLAVADLLVGLALTPATTVCHFMTSLKCDWSVISTTSLLFFFASVGNLCAITVDRYVAVVIPLKYSLFKTTRVRLRLILCAWVVPCFLSFIPLAWYRSSPEFKDVANRRFYAVQTIALIFVPCVLMLQAFLHITLVIRRQHRVVLSYTTSPLQSRQLRNVVRSKREATTSLKVYGSILVFFVACWCLSAYRYLRYSFELAETSAHVVRASRLLMLINSAINPAIYALMKRDIRAELRSLVGVAAETTDTSGHEKRARSRHTAEQGDAATDAL